MQTEWAKQSSAEIEVVFLGTSSGVPTLKRNLPAIALVRQGEVFLFDCGEGTQHQLRRSGVRMGRLRHIFLTHFHGDHVTGLPGLLMSLQMSERTTPLSLYGPPGLGEMIRFFQRMMHTHFTYELQILEFEEEGKVLETEAYWVEARRLEHRVLTFGFALVERPRPGRFDVEKAQRLGIPPGPLFGQLQRGEAVRLPDGRWVLPEEVIGPSRPGRRIAYCTDTRPCPNGVELARGADLLIHEATFTHDLYEEAVFRGHSTAREAAQVALEAGASSLILTHFSPRYQKVEPLLEEARALFPRTWAAHDLARFQVALPKGDGHERENLVQKVPSGGQRG